MPNIEFINKLVDTFDKNIAWLEKKAFTPAAPPAGPATGGPPPGGDPNMPPPGPPGPPGPPPPPGGDPNMMPPGGDPNMMPPGGDPNMMPPGGDQNMMPPGGDPNMMPPGGGAPPQGPIPPELEQALSELSGGVEGIAQQTQETQAQMDQLAQRQLANEQEISKLREELKTPAPYEGSPSM